MIIVSGIEREICSLVEDFGVKWGGNIQDIFGWVT
jgi:hypothetical protein